MNNFFKPTSKSILGSELMSQFNCPINFPEVEENEGLKRNVAIFPKDAIVCDVCNDQLSDANFIATQASFWYEGWLYCDSCNKKYRPMRELKLIAEILKGANLSDTELAKPIKVISWDEEEKA